MKQLSVFLKRLKNPTVIISLVAEVLIILQLFNFDVDETQVNAVVTTIMSILLTMGIISNPDTKKKTFNDDISVCTTCKTSTVHTNIAGSLLCTDCGNKKE